MSTVGCDEAYEEGLKAYSSGGNWSDPPDYYTPVEKSLWRVGFDEASASDWLSDEDEGL